MIEKKLKGLLVRACTKVTDTVTKKIKKTKKSTAYGRNSNITVRFAQIFSCGIYWIFFPHRAA